MEEKNWNTPKPGEWRSEELSQGRVIDYKAYNFVDGEGYVTPFTCQVVCSTVKGVIMLRLGHLRQGNLTRKS